MTSKAQCFYAGCTTSPSWGVESSAAPKNPDGTPWYLFACDDHETMITADLRRAGTKYSLFPVIGPPIACTCEEPDDAPNFGTDSYEAELATFPWHVRFMVNAITAVITPPIFLYYGIRWACGWRPEE